MRPRRARLGWLAAGGTTRAVEAASMRPRRARLGWARHPRRAPGYRPRASMRPRRARLGWRRSRRPASSPTPRFNEAEARTPRMERAEIAENLLVARASMRPRRARLGWGANQARSGASHKPASMRPRRARLGWPRSTARRHPSSRCFNEAEARTPRMGPPSPLFARDWPPALQ